MATVVKVQENGNQLTVIFSDGSRVQAYPQTAGLWAVASNTNEVISIQQIGNNLAVNYIGGDTDIGYQVSTTLFYVHGTHEVIVPPTLVDTISPGHHITNPGGTIESGWTWHVENADGRGGDDWNYNFENFTAPGAGTVDHFNVGGVGQVTRLTLDTPAVRTQPQQPAGFDQFGPMVAIFFEHTSAAFDGHANVGDVIGVSGDGGGLFAPHLHVHGMINLSTTATNANRCCFWGFL